ncbi:MAG: DNA-3-methyladenine glycosylase I [Methylococcaceae bacterium]|nr:DNA-3-methyladenine glycosylase I [Methylococcaceae bacterium]
MQRCEWAMGTELEREYHDTIWGVPVHDDNVLFEFLILEGAQAGLSWLTILKRREGYKQAFDNFNIEKIAAYNDEKIAELLLNPQIIRNRLKVNATIVNAQAFLKIQQQYGSFDAYIWSFVDGKTIHNHYQSLAEVPASTDISKAMSKDLKKKGFKFVGETICYAYMQAMGMVNDHTVGCFRYQPLKDAHV